MNLARQRTFLACAVAAAVVLPATAHADPLVTPDGAVITTPEVVVTTPAVVTAPGVVTTTDAVTAPAVVTTPGVVTAPVVAPVPEAAAPGPARVTPSEPVLVSPAPIVAPAPSVAPAATVSPPLRYVTPVAPAYDDLDAWVDRYSLSHGGYVSREDYLREMARRWDASDIDGRGLTPAEMSRLTGHVDTNALAPLTGSGAQPGNMGPGNSRGE